MERVKLEYDQVTEERSVTLRLSPALAEVLENMFFVAFGIADMYAAKKLGKPYPPKSREAAMTSTDHLLASPREALDAMGDVVREIHCLVHHPGKTCEEMLEEHGGDQEGEAWKH